MFPDTANYDLQLQLQACQSNSRRNGKVARLPKSLRDQINRLLEDGLTYKQIIQNLGPAGQHLNEDNLSNWRLGGYQDYLKAQAINTRALVQTEAAAQAVRESGVPAPDQLRQVCAQIALLQYIEIILERGQQSAREALKRNPAKFITLVNSCCNVSRSTITREKRRRKP